MLSGPGRVFDRGVFDCVIRNLSDGGARIACDQQVVLPDVFDLILVKQQERKRVRAIWRGGEAIGLSFVGEDEYTNVLSFSPTAQPVSPYALRRQQRQGA